MKRAHIRPAVILPVSLAIFLSLSLYQVDLPGLYYDEAADAAPAMQVLLGQKIDRGSSLELFGRDLPVMVMDYVGAVNSYALLPFFAVLGINVFSIRLMTILGGAATIVLTFLLTRRLFDWKAASAASLVLAVQPSFVFFSRQGIYVTSLLSVFATASLWLLLRWWHGQGVTNLLGAAFLLGLGLSAKLLFLWFIGALAFLFLVLLLLKKSPSVKGYAWQLMLAVPPFVLGVGMLILHNVRTSATLNVLLKNLARTDYGVENAALLPNLLTRLDSFRVLLDGGFFWFFGDIFHAWLYLPIFLASAAVVLVLAFLRKLPWPLAILLLGLTSLVLVESIFTVSGIWPTHLYTLLPVVAIIIGLAATRAFDMRGRIRMAAVVLSLGVLAILVGQSLYVDVRYHQTLSTTGGRRAHSDAIYRLASYLDSQNQRAMLAMDWGITTSVQVLTVSRVLPKEVFGYGPEPSQLFFDQVYKGLNDPQTLYLFHAPDSTVFKGRYEAFEGLAQKFEKQPALDAEILERDGTVVYRVYSAK